MELIRDLVLLQRGDPVLLTFDQYKLWAKPLESLVTQRLVSIESRKNGISVRPGAYVGAARTRAGVLKIIPRNARLFDFLLHRFRRYAREYRIDAGPGQANVRDIVQEAFDCCLSVISWGGPPEYIVVTSREATRGSFKIDESIRAFWSRGINHRAVRSFSRVNRPGSAAALAGHVLIRVQSDFLLSEEEEVSFAHLLERVGRLSDWNRRDVVALINEVSVLDVPEAKQLAAVAREIFLSDVTSTGVLSGADDDVSFRFYDTEALWEMALADILTSVVGNGLQVKLHPLRKSRPPFISEGGPLIDPDIMIFRDDIISMVVDAKSFHATAPSSSDIYQMHAYMTQLETSRGLIIYICEDGPWLKKIGNAHSSIYSIGISAHSLVTKAEAVKDLSMQWARLLGDQESA